MYLVTHECIIAIVNNEKLYLFHFILYLIVGMLETVHSVDTATLGGLGGIPLMSSLQIQVLKKVY